MGESRPSNITWDAGQVGRADRRRLLGCVGGTVWLTGLSGSGKSTIAGALERVLLERGVAAYRLDGDNIRHGLNSNLDFSAEDRAENIRRVGEVAKLFADACVLTIVSFISPYRADRELARRLHEDAGLPFIEVHADCPLEVAEQRDPKGLYKKARAGQITQFTGLDAPYEAPERPDVHVRTDRQSVAEAVGAILGCLRERGLVGGDGGGEGSGGVGECGGTGAA